MGSERFWSTPEGVAAARFQAAGGTNPVVTMWSTMTESGKVEPQRKFGLTSRELEILAAVVGGYSYNEIARKLSISERHVVQELTEVCRKLGVEGRLELALFAIHHSLLTDRDS